jgi:hypothetical protein
MRLEDHGMEFERDGHKVRIGSIETERSHTGRKRHFRRIFIDEVEVSGSKGKSLNAARFAANVHLEYKINMEKKLRKK